MAMQFVMRITFLFLLTYGLAEAASPPMAKPHCKSMCGNLVIPHTFGIGRDCYMDQSFEIVCNGSGSFLASIDMEVRQINISLHGSLHRPTVQVQMPIISKNCMNTTTSTISTNFTGSRFSFSGLNNTFISVGCDNFATIANIAPKVYGCTSDCNTNMKKTDFSGHRCAGFNCCESSNIPYDLQAFAVDFRSINETKGSGGPIEPCKYAFLADQNWWANSKGDPSSVQYWEYVPVVLDWQMFTWFNESDHQFFSFQNRPDISLYASDTFYSRWLYSYYVTCARGYQGNPYLPNGCKEGKLQIHKQL